MKQNLPPAKIQKLIIAFLVVAVFATACVTLPRQTLEVRSNVASQNGIVLLNINTASVNQLETLPGIGKVIAERIVAHREQFGPFRRAEHLMTVRGISDQKFRAIREMIFVD